MTRRFPLEHGPQESPKAQGDGLAFRCEILVLRTERAGGGILESVRELQVEGPEASGRVPRARLRRPLRVLVVDDDDGCRQSVASFLSDEGHEILAASRGLEAIERVARLSGSGEPLDVSILDCNMPDLSGVETFRRIARLVPGLQGAFMSAHLSAELLEDLRRVGGRLFIEKPLDVPRLRRAFEYLYAQAEPS